MNELLVTKPSLQTYGRRRCSKCVLRVCWHLFLRVDKESQKTLDYLFHDLLPRGGFSQTYTFIRDRSRAVRNDLTLQHELGSIAIECHDRCARFHILALHLERDKTGFSVALEEQQLMNSTCSSLPVIQFILTAKIQRCRV